RSCLAGFLASEGGCDGGLLPWRFHMKPLLNLAVGFALAEPGCFDEYYTYSMCCSPLFGAEGNTKCWSSSLTFERCCTGAVLAVQSAGRHLLAMQDYGTPRFPPLGECRGYSSLSGEVDECQGATPCKIVELGTQDGLNVRRWARKFPNASIYSLEPFASERAWHEAAFQAGELSREKVHFLPYGASDKAQNGTAESRRGQETIELRPIRDVLDEILALEGHVNFLYVNCEGCEYPVLQAALPVWDRWNIPLLSVEWHAGMPWLGPEPLRKSRRCELETQLKLKGALQAALESQDGVMETWRMQGCA
ncbi:unnamed protein product, partial [Effrenium voratum]